MRQRSVDIGINKTDGIKSDHADDTQVAVAAIEVFFRLQCLRKPRFVDVLLLCGGWIEIHITFRVRIAVHDVSVGFRIVREHPVVP